MNKNKTEKSSGFGIVEITLVLLIVGILGFIGWMVYKNQTKATSPAAQPARSTPASTSAKPVSATTTISLGASGKALETFQLPNNWVIYKDAFPQGGTSTTGGTGCSQSPESSVNQLDGGSVFPKALASEIKATNVSLILGYGIAKQLNNKPLSQYFTEDLIGGEDGAQDAVRIKQTSTINGYTTYYYDTNDKNYRDFWYLVSNNGYVACFSGRIISNHFGLDGKMDEHIDNTQYLTDIKNIVGSIKFPN